MKKIGLVIGYGSIGKQHYAAMKSLNIFKKIYILSKHFKSQNTIKNIKEIKSINPDLIIISSETYNHYSQLRYLEKKFKNKIILIEKPVFSKFKRLKIKNNKVFVGYNLRYHPIIQYLKSFLHNKKIIIANIICNSYLPSWRKRNYKHIYSSIKNKGGGVHLDLSHEIDYSNWIFGNLKTKEISLKKLSSLKINSYDYFNLTGFSNLTKLININLNYFSRKNKRFIEIIMNNQIINADLIVNKVEFFKNNNSKVKKFKNFSSQKTLELQLKDILKLKPKYACTYEEGLKVIKSLENK